MSISYLRWAHWPGNQEHKASVWKHLLCIHFVSPVLLLQLGPNSFFQICPGVQSLLSPSFSQLSLPHSLTACPLVITASHVFALFATFLAWFVFGCLSFFVNEAKPMGRNPHKLISASLGVSHLHVLLFSAESVASFSPPASVYVSF